MITIDLVVCTVVAGLAVTFITLAEEGLIVAAWMEATETGLGELLLATADDGGDEIVKGDPEVVMTGEVGVEEDSASFPASVRVRV